MRYVLDADVLIGALDANDAHHRAARQMLTSWHAQGDSVSISVVNLAEVLVAPAADPHLLRRARAAIAALGVDVHHPTEAIGADAARLRARNAITLPDAYVLATARRLLAAAASFDPQVLRAAEAEEIRSAAGP